VFLRHSCPPRSSVLGFAAGSFAASVSTLITIFWEPSGVVFPLFAMVLTVYPYRSSP